MYVLKNFSSFFDHKGAKFMSRFEQFYVESNSSVGWLQRRTHWVQTGKLTALYGFSVILMAKINLPVTVDMTIGSVTLHHFCVS